MSGLYSGSTVSKDSSIEVDGRKFGPLQIPMDHRLMEAVRSGDKSKPVQLLSPKVAAPCSATEEIRVDFLETDISLLGVTVVGNTALHIAASNGYLELAEEICDREKSLLMAANTKLDTPLHCAARAGHHQMVDLIIRFAREVGQDVVNEVLRAKNMDGDTALHDATRNGHLEVTRKLMEHDAELASMVNDAVISPLYFAVISGSLDVVRAIINPSKKTATQTSIAGPDDQTASSEKTTLPDAFLKTQGSAAGPSSADSQIISSEERATPISTIGLEGQTALHVAVLRWPEIAGELLRWKPGLTNKVDDCGSTPLHYVASIGDACMLDLLLKYDPLAAGLADINGSTPIHVAASMGFNHVIDKLIQHCPDAEELLDNDGNNFLHIAILKKEWRVVEHVCSAQKFEKLMNNKNYVGDTPLHLAIKTGDRRIVKLLMQHKSVRTSMMDKMGSTPLDVLRRELPDRVPMVATFMVSIFMVAEPQHWIFFCLKLAGARYRPRRGDSLIHEKNLEENPEKAAKILEERSKEEAQKYRSMAKNAGVAAVLVATVTFAAAFAVPGGYEPDDRPSPSGAPSPIPSGAPVLARRGAFKLFILLDAFSMVYSVTATQWLTTAATKGPDNASRTLNVASSLLLISIAAKSMVAAFALGIYAMLSPIIYNIGIGVCASCFGAIAYWDLVDLFPLCSPLCALGTTVVRRVGWKDGLLQIPEQLSWRTMRLIVLLLVTHYLLFYGIIVYFAAWVIKQK